MLAEWQQHSVVVNAYHGSYLTLGPVTTRMGDCLWAGKPSGYVTSHLG